MAIAFDAASGVSNTGTTNPLTVSHTTSGSDRILFVFAGAVSFPDAPLVSAVTYNGVAMTAIPSFAQLNHVVDSLDVRVQGFYLVAPATGANTISATWTGGLSVDRWMIGVSYTGVDQSTPLGTAAGATGTTDPSSVTVSSAAGELVVDAICVSQDTITVGAGQTSRREQENINFETSGGSSTEPGAASVDMTWTFSAAGIGDQWAAAAVPVKPAGGGEGETITLDKWLGRQEPRPRLRIVVLPSGIITIKS